MNRRTNKEFIKKDEEFGQRMVDVARVTRVMAGGKRMKFRICLAIGDKKGRVGIGIAKGTDVTQGINKALNKAKKNLVKVPFHNDTIPFPVLVKFKAAKIMLKPAKRGNGIKAGGPVRILAELAGIPNITAKILGSNNKINVAKATIKAFQVFEADKKAKKIKGESKIEATVAKKEAEIPVEDNAKKEEKKTLRDKLKNIISKKENS